MKKFIVFLIFNLLIINPSQADDIRDLQIEGMSIGDSALKHFNENTLTSSRYTTYKDDEFYSVDIMEKFGEYDAIQLHLKKDDKKYIIYGVSGAILFGEAAVYYPESEKECKNRSLEIERDFNNLFLNAKKQSGRDVGVGHSDPGVKDDTYYFDSVKCSYTFKKFNEEVT